MQDRPTAIELLEAAAQFIDRDIVPIAEGSRQFQARVAANVMRIVAREIRVEEFQLREEIAALSALLGRSKSETSSVQQMRETALALSLELVERIKAGDADKDPWRQQVFDVVRMLVEEKLKVANPRYLESDLAARRAR